MKDKKENQKELLIAMIKADEKDGLYEEESFSYDEMKRCAEFWNQGYIEKKYFDEFLKKRIMKNEQIFLNGFFIVAVGLIAYLNYDYKNYEAAMVFSVILGALLTSFIRQFKR